MSAGSERLVVTWTTSLESGPSSPHALTHRPIGLGTEGVKRSAHSWQVKVTFSMGDAPTETRLQAEFTRSSSSWHLSQARPLGRRTSSSLASSAGVNDVIDTDSWCEDWGWGCVMALVLGAFLTTRPLVQFIPKLIQSRWLHGPECHFCRSSLEPKQGDECRSGLDPSNAPHKLCPKW
jgi:hypothetical protein